MKQQRTEGKALMTLPRPNKSYKFACDAYGVLDISINASIISSLSAPMGCVDLPAIECWWWRFLAGFERSQQVSIFFQQVEDRSDQPADHTTHCFHFSLVCFEARVPDAMFLYQLTVSISPLAVVFGAVHADKEHGLLCHSVAPLRQPGYIFAGTGLCTNWAPTEQSSQLRGLFKVVDIVDSSNDHCRLRRANDPKAEQNLALSRCAYDGTKAIIKFFGMPIEQSQLLNESHQFKTQCFNTYLLGDANAFARQFLELQQFCVARIASRATCLDLCKAGLSNRCWRCEALQEIECRLAAGVFDDLCHLGEDFINDGPDLIFSSRNLSPQLKPVPCHTSCLRGCLRWRSVASHGVFGVDDFCPQADLIKQRLRQAPRIDFVGLITAEPLVCVDNIDDAVRMLEVLNQSATVVSCFLKKHMDLSRRIALDFFQEQLKAWAAIWEWKCRTNVTMLASRRKSRGDNSGDMLLFANVDTKKQINWLRVGIESGKRMSNNHEKPPLALAGKDNVVVVARRRAGGDRGSCVPKHRRGGLYAPRCLSGTPEPPQSMLRGIPCTIRGSMISSAKERATLLCALHLYYSLLINIYAILRPISENTVISVCDISDYSVIFDTLGNCN